MVSWCCSVIFNTNHSRILNSFNANLLYYKRYIDDVFGIWIETPNQKWDEFKTTLNQFGNLKWNVEELNTTCSFLDLQITITNNRITTKTFQKPMNLYLYIPPLSAPPTSCFKGLVIGEIIIL